jgi:hypothetical protein
VWFFLAAPAFAQVAKPTVVLHPLELQANPALERFAEPLRASFNEQVRTRGGVLMPMKKEADRAFAELKRRDCREANDCLAQFASRASTLYAIYAELAYSQAKVLTLSARVVRDDGKVMKTAAVKIDKGSDTIVEAAKVLINRTLEELQLGGLPNFKEVRTVEPVKTVEVAPKDPVVLPPPPSLPPAVVAEDTGAPRRMAGKSLVIAGGGIVLVGGVLGGIGLGVGSTLAPSPNGSIAAGDLSKAQTASTLRTTGVIVLGVGAVVAAIGAVVWATAPAEPAAHVFFAPQAGGAVVGFSGAF